MNLQFVIAAHDRNFLTYQTDTPAIDNFIRTTFREQNKEAKYQKTYGGKLDPFKTPITALGSFRPGLFFDIVNAIQRKFSNMVNIIVPPEIMERIHPSDEAIEIFNINNEQLKLRDYQKDVVHLGAKWGRGVYAHATGAGKSVSMYCLIRSLEQNAPGIRTLIIVPGVGLVEQLYNDFLEYGCPVYKLQKYCRDSDALPVADIIIVNQEFLQPRKKRVPLKDKDGKPVRNENGRMKMECTNDIASNRALDVNGYDMLIIDECQQLKSQTTFIYKFVEKYPALLKFGFSGSIAETGMDRWNVCGVLGPVLDEIQPHELQDVGVLAPLNLSVIQFLHSKMPQMPHIKDEDERRRLEYSAEWDFIETNNFCNEFIVDICGSHDGENTIILFDHTKHGRVLFKLIDTYKDPTTKVFYIDGSIDAKERESIRNYVKTHSDCVIVANSECMSTGINIPNLNNMIFAFSYGTARDKIMQAAGRVLRTAKNKTHAQIYIICHNLKYSLRHVKQQLAFFDKYYKIGAYAIEKIIVKD